MRARRSGGDLEGQGESQGVQLLARQQQEGIPRTRLGRVETQPRYGARKCHSGSANVTPPGGKVTGTHREW